MEIVFRQLNPHACRTYLIGTTGSTEVVLIDPVLEHVQGWVAYLALRIMLRDLPPTVRMV